MEELFGQKNVKLAFTKKSLHISILVQTAVPPDHWFQWFFDGFGVLQPLASMVFNGNGPLVQRCDGFNVSFTSSTFKRPVQMSRISGNKGVTQAAKLKVILA